MIESHANDRDQENIYYDDENPYHTDILDRPDLFYGNPDDVLEDGDMSYPGGAYMEEPDGYNGYGWNDPTNSFDAAAVRGMVRIVFFWTYSGVHGGPIKWLKIKNALPF